ncbi:fluoride efflux transporter CrcB [Haloprofundus salilacus]|uniref:fluoride efflux transporter CrcB n=1 Tax=Haloprofundus salilacus TaxID=2876190 RepID=UPI001CCB83C7|nr:fluoride efflux transporter CrcB [Haloprofundus salilacus]
MMALEPAHLVGTGGAIGALLRYAVGQLVDDGSFPLSTLTVNVLGSFVLGVVTFAGVGDSALLLVGTGACGSFTTFSSFSFETVRLWEMDEKRRAVANATVNLVGAGLALGVAWLVASGRVF